MSRLNLLLLGLLALGATGCAAHAHPAARGGYSVQLVDEWGGNLPTYHHSGSTYVMGAYGRAYGVKVTNHTGQRIEAVVTVDGRDVISGQNGDYRNQRGYIVDPYGTITVEGFRQSDTSVATFRFTNPGDSYSARMGTPQNVGVVGVAVFQERIYRRPVFKKRARPAPRAEYWGGADKSSAAPMQDEAAAAPRRSSGRSYEAPRAPVNNIGTRYGESRHSAVVEVPFKRRSSSPNHVLAVYYDDANGLANRGVLTRPQPYHAHNPQAFPRNEYAPPPPR